jgi:hypothetical protein
MTTRPNAASIRAVEPIYVAAMLEELQLFSVMDRLVALFQSGVLPITSHGSGKALYAYWRQQPPRLTAGERRSLYARVLGLGTPDAGGTPNREFAELWLRFVSAVAAFAGLGAGADPAERALRQHAVRQAGRDLAANLSLHGYGIAYFSARELQRQLETITSVLAAPDVRSAYGARSMWDVVHKVAASDLGGAPDIARYRALAEGGATVIRWLARKARALARESARPILGNQPGDRRLTAACERWLLARGQPSGEPET